jgi:hypothetical protein
MEIAQAYQWIYTTLSADSTITSNATGGIWQGVADIASVPPVVIYNHQANTDITTMQEVRLFTSLLIQIKAVGYASNFAALVTLANRIDTLFGNVRNVGLSPGGVLCAYREGQIAYDEPLVNGRQYSHLGALYRIELQGA